MEEMTSLFRPNAAAPSSSITSLFLSMPGMTPHKFSSKRQHRSRTRSCSANGSRFAFASPTTLTRPTCWFKSATCSSTPPTMPTLISTSSCAWRAMPSTSGANCTTVSGGGPRGDRSGILSALGPTTSKSFNRGAAGSDGTAEKKASSSSLESLACIWFSSSPCLSRTSDCLVKTPCMFVPNFCVSPTPSAMKVSVVRVSRDWILCSSSTNSL
mmetsp:Transcript_49543/g.138702  ORF Transcript_49543/g.138702 Transcript_49543/m.138702 type:complete len:213 (-) Transcript_49543:465-1103(-)